MVRIDGEIVINRPVDTVFDFVADERNEPRYNPRMLRVEKLSPGPIGVGSRFRAAMRTRPRPTKMTTEFTGYERPWRLAWILVQRIEPWLVAGHRALPQPHPVPGNGSALSSRHPHGSLR